MEASCSSVQHVKNFRLLFIILFIGGLAFTQSIGDAIRRLPDVSSALPATPPSRKQLSTDEKRSAKELAYMVKQIERRAHKEPGFAALVMGEALASGVGVQQDVPAALSWLSVAANEGLAEADYQIGKIYDLGLGVPANIATAVRYYMRAADSHNVVAEVRLGEIFERGIGVTVDPKEAEHWYESAALRGSVAAAERLGDLYSSAGGDYAEAVRWYRQASKAQDMSAEVKLAVLYAEGKGTPRDPKQAMDLLVAASHTGAPDALYRLGQTIEGGSASPINYKTAYILYSLSAASGSSQAAQAANTLGTKMKGESLSKAQAAASSIWSSIAARVPRK